MVGNNFRQHLLLRSRTYTYAYYNVTQGTSVMLASSTNSRQTFNSVDVSYDNGSTWENLNILNWGGSYTPIQTGTLLVRYFYLRTELNGLSSAQMYRIDIGDNITSLNQFALQNCNNLTTIYWGKNIVSSHGQTFAYTSKITHIHIADIDKYFNWRFGGYAFVYTPWHLYKDGVELFDLDITITTPEARDQMFRNAGYIKSVVFHNVIAFDENTFSCPELESIDLPDTLTDVGKNFIISCPKLTTIICRAPIPPTMTSDGIKNVSRLAAIKVPSASVDAYKTAQGWSAHASKIIAI